LSLPYRKNLSDSLAQARLLFDDPAYRGRRPVRRLVAVLGFGIVAKIRGDSALLH
jgi:hypothetical protein